MHICLTISRPNMATTRISNVSTRSRIKQIFLLIVAIIIGILISEAATAQRNFHKSKVVHYKIEYKVQVHKSSKVCEILNKKRNYVAKSSFFARGLVQAARRETPSMSTRGVMNLRITEWISMIKYTNIWSCCKRSRLCPSTLYTLIALKQHSLRE